MHDLLRRLVSEGTSDFFADACDIAQDQPSHRTKTHLVGHLMREVESSTILVLKSLPTVTKCLEANPGSENAGHRAAIDAILVGLQLPDPKLSTAWRSFAGGNGWNRTAHRDQLRMPRAPDAEFQKRLGLFVDILFEVLDAAEGHYTQMLRALEATCTKPSPSKEDFRAVAERLAPGTTALRPMFELLSAKWLVPLRERRVFADPPDVLVHEDKSFSFPGWPQADYLARIAGDAPEEVARTIIESVPVVNNESVHIRFLEAACRMPSGDASRVGEHESGWIAGRDWISDGLPQHIEALVTRLINDGELPAATSLLRAVLGFMTSESMSSDRTARVSSWSYGQLVEKTIPKLTARSPQIARDLLHELIGDARETDAWDYERHVEDPVHRQTGEPFDFLFAHLRDLYVVTAAGSEALLRQAVVDMEARSSDAYDRLALHLLRIHGHLAPDLVVERACDQQRLDNTSLAGELTLMIRDQMQKLEHADQQRIVAALRENSTEGHARAKLANSADPATVARYARLTRLRWFHDLGPARPAEIAKEYEELVGMYGEPQVHVPRVLFGPRSPQRAIELLALSDEDLLTFLRGWTPSSSDVFDNSRAGLAREIQACAREQTERFSRIARAFRRLDPEYVACLLWGLHEGIKRNAPSANEPAPALTHSIDWDSVLDLVEWTIAQRSANPDVEEWQWASRRCLDLARDLFVRPSARSREHIRRTLTIVRSLMNDADPSPERVAKNTDDVTAFAANTVRGEAMHAALDIATTLRTNRDASSTELVASIVSETARHVDPEVEPCLAVRCVLAMRFSHLFNLDAHVANTVQTKLFPRDGESSVERQTAWETFLDWNLATPATFAVLGQSYAFATEAVERASLEAASALGTHLVKLAWLGTIDPTAESGLIQAFIERASVEARAKALHDFGFSLYHAKKPIPAQILERIRTLWETWTDFAIASGDGSDLDAFGWCVGSDHFDPTWLLAMLDRVLDATRGAIEMEHEVAPRLSSLASAHPERVAACLRRFVNGRDDWRLSRNREHLRAALAALRETGVAAEARKIASRLVARGQHEFRDLAE